MLANGRDLPEVALRKESVDRNVENDELEKTLIVVALRKESVDRNPCQPGAAGRHGVALRKESVDRNQFDNFDPTRPVGSLSARRAWIEINPRPRTTAGCRCRSPQGERG